MKVGRALFLQPNLILRTTYSSPNPSGVRPGNAGYVAPNPQKVKIKMEREEKEKQIVISKTQKLNVELNGKVCFQCGVV